MAMEFRNEQDVVYKAAYDNTDAREEDNDDSDDAEESLRAKVLRSMEESRFDKTPKSYLPRHEFDAIFSIQSGREDLQNLPVFKPMGFNPAFSAIDDRSLAGHILQNSKKLYLIAVFSELKPRLLRKLMSIFRQHGFTDEQLPIDTWSMDKMRGGIETHPLVSMEKRFSTQRPHIWNFERIVGFQSNQCMFLAPRISTNKIFHDFRQNTVPFVKKHSVVKKGGRGDIHKYDIHYAHFKDPLHASAAGSKQHVTIAVKEIRKEGDEVASRWEKEVRAMEKMNELKHEHIVRILTSFRRRGTSDDIEYYIVYEWADGGNLNDFRTEYPNPDMTPILVKWITRQLHGLVQAISKAHYLDEEGSYRHGDLKPENILWFKEGYPEFGMLKIGDWGEAKEHFNGTAFRDRNGNNTTAQYGTRRYEPPEVQTGLSFELSDKNSGRVRSRLYDIWGIGCVTLELIIWLMYGLGELKKFNKEEMGDYGMSGMFYEVSLGKPAKVHAIVEHYMEHMANDPRCVPVKTALGDLLEIVRTLLLVVKLPPEGGAKRPPVHPNQFPEPLVSDACGFLPAITTSEILEPGSINNIAIHLTEELQDPIQASPGEPTRCRADHLEQHLKKILSNDRDDYWCERSVSNPAPSESRPSDLLSVKSASIARSRDTSDPWSNGSKERDYGTNNPDSETWTFQDDNTFANDIFSRLRVAGLPSPRVSSTLCADCRAVGGDILDPYFKKTYEVVKLKWNASQGLCDLCCLFWHTYQKFSSTESREVKFRRVSTMMIKMDDLKSPVLTLFQNNSENHFPVSTMV
jgi:serine/threonine protein kinase